MTDQVALLIPILGIVFGIGGPMLAVIYGILYSHKTKVARYDTLKRVLEGNLTQEQVEVAIQSLSGAQSPPVNPRKKSLSTGIILLCLATGILLGSLLVNVFRGFAFASLVLGFLGIGNILIALFVQKDDGGDHK